MGIYPNLVNGSECLPGLQSLCILTLCSSAKPFQYYCFEIKQSEKEYLTLADFYKTSDTIGDLHSTLSKGNLLCPADKSNRRKLTLCLLVSFPNPDEIFQVYSHEIRTKIIFSSTC
jgi:hypothetical protein